ncbi:MAG: glycoside hydrolase family 9 protein [Saprospiraceae bacterium]
MRLAILFLFICAQLVLAKAQSSQLIDLLPLTEQILMVRFDDGYVDHHDQGQAAEEDVVISYELDEQLASLNTNYQIISTADPNYTSPINPTRVYRKSKPTDFANYCQRWGPGCINDSLDHTKEHWLYLELPFPLKNDFLYTLVFRGVPGQQDATWLQDDRKRRSEAVHVNQIGYVADAGEKFGYVYHWMGDGGGLNLNDSPRDFHLIETTSDALAFSGQVAFRKDSSTQEIAYPSQSPPNGNLLGANVWECDFSSFRQNGSYRLCVDGVGCSFPFEIADDVYRAPLEAVLSGLYQQRSGIETTAPFTDQPRPAPHNPLLTPDFAGRLKYSSIRASEYDEFDAPFDQKTEIDNAILGTIETAGWYQDAGDWDSYVTHSEVPTMMLWLFEMAPDKWGDGQLNLPENSNGFPDLLDEAAWLPRFYQRLRAELLAKNYGTGGVGGSRIFGDLWGEDYTPDGKLRGSWEDTDRDWIVSGEDPFITYAYAGLAAHMSVLLSQNQLSDPQGIDWRQEAIDSYAWAKANTLATETDLSFGYPLSHLQLYASACLWRMTNDVSYEADFAASFSESKDDDLSTHVLFGMANYRAGALEQTANPALLDEVKTKIQADGNFVMEAFRDDRSARWGGNWFVPLIIGQATTPLVQAGVVAHYFAELDAPSNQDLYRDGLYSTADYFLGNNPLNQTWITGLGERSPEHIFNLDSWILGGENPRSGVTPYGPWSKEFIGFPNSGPFDPRWAFQKTYPLGEDNWPAHERWFNQRTAPLSTEYTVHQNMAPQILTYGYLYSLTAPDFVSGARTAVAKTHDLYLSPNPAKSIVRLFGEDAKGVAMLQVYSSNGQLMIEQKNTDATLDLTMLPSGAYSVVATFKRGDQTTRKLVIE